MFLWLNWIGLICTRLNKFEIFNEFEMMKITMKFFLRVILRKCKTVSRKLYINGEYNIYISQFIYTDMFVTRTMKFPEVVILPSIYQFSPIWVSLILYVCTSLPRIWLIRSNIVLEVRFTEVLGLDTIPYTVSIRYFLNSWPISSDTWS